MNARHAPLDVRVVAAQALERIVRGESLRAAFAASSIKLVDARDRSLLSNLLFEAARWWLRYAAAVTLLLQRPLAARETQAQALLVLGLVQLDVLLLPQYAAVAATVEAMRSIGRPQFAALANALMRRWLRERDTLVAALDVDTVTRSAHPRWMLDTFEADWPAHADAIVHANNIQAPLWLRANLRKTSRDALLARWRSAGIEARAAAQLDQAIIIAHSTDVTRLPGFVEGEFSVQDGAAQFAASLLDARSGERVLDACAAPGGKSAHILEHSDAKLLALDSDANRLPRLRENLARLGLQAEVAVGDATRPDDWWDKIPFDRILIDAPCSATGIIRRQPDIKLHRREDDLASLTAMQQRLLEALWPLLALGGRLVYATCSVLQAENSEQIAQFEATRRDARRLSLAPPGWHDVRGFGAQNLPGEFAMDGFFYAVLEKVQ